jgi:hypothetical protein
MVNVARLSRLMALATCLLVPCLALAAPLTDAQYAALGTDVTVTSAAEFGCTGTSPNATCTSSDQTVADAYNVNAAVDCWAWRTNVLKGDIYFQTSVDATTWSWPTYINQTAGEKAGWAEMFYLNTVNFALPNVQAAVANIFGGTGPPAAQRTHINTIARRKTKRGEKLFKLDSGTGITTGNCSTATPSTMTFEGDIRRIDIAHVVRGVPLP